MSVLCSKLTGMLDGPGHQLHEIFVDYELERTLKGWIPSATEEVWVGRRNLGS